MKTTQSRLSARLLCGAGAAAILALSSPALAEVRQFDIPSQSLGEALARFGAQSDLAVVSTSELTRTKSSQAVAGAIEPEVALAQLLNGTGLSFRRDGDTFLIVSASDPQSGSAAGDGADQGTVQALIVTAQKREENIQDVPIAMSAFTQEDLTRSQVAGGPDLMTQVPNFTFTKTNFTGYSIQIRGIGTQAISATTDAAVAVAFNNTPFIRNRFFEQEFYDLQRVEVLRGPQGTLYGRNATAGVVNLLSQKPKFSYEAKLSADVGNFSSTRLEGMINLPLVDDKVALRLAGAWTKRDGYDVNQITGSRIDGRDLWSTRLSLRIDPTDNISANLIWEHFQEEDDRLRSGKQLCYGDNRTEIQGYHIEPTQGYSAIFSQGCLPASLYSPDSYQAPNGLSLPYYLPLGGIFLPVVEGLNPYASVSQSPNLRVIESTYDPKYRAKTDLAEIQVSVDLPNNLTLTSETAYLADALYSIEDYNRFNTRPGVFNQEHWDTVVGPFEGIYRQNLLNNGVFCDPQIGCTDRVVAVDQSTARSRQFSQEFRLASNYDGDFNFSLGANFLRYDTMEKYYVFINTLTMISAISQTGHPTLAPYTPNVTDNTECLQQGMAPPDFTKPLEVTKCNYIDPNPIGSLNDQGHNYFLSKNPYKLISYALFGEAYYNLTDNLKLTAGARWTVDKKEAPRIPSWILGSMTAGYPVYEVVRQEWNEPTGRLTLDWKPDLSITDETLLYASLSHGYKAGGSNPPPTGIVVYAATGNFAALGAIRESALKPKTFDPEFVNALEIGTKNTLADGRMTLNADIFYYDYTGYQISQIVDRSAVNYNFDAKIWGAEIEADWRPLENLRLGFKAGYEKSRVADGMKAIDIMDRTAGHDGWVVVRPFPTFASNCVLPTSMLYDPNWGDPPTLTARDTYVNGIPGPCEYAYLSNEGFGGIVPIEGPNGGQGFDKDLSGHELPNAPHFTATITADYTVPLPSDWLMTLHTDLYYQSEAWARIFNTEGYDKLKAYSNINLAAIFSNEDRGWTVMAYIKNVLDKDNITGAFLNSDDTGLTTNIFLNEPRLYGLRVTKNWSDIPWLSGGAKHPAGEPYRLIVELSGQVQRQDAPYSTLVPSFTDEFDPLINPTASQHRRLDWGDGREVKVTYRPGGAWSVSGAYRYGRTNTRGTQLHAGIPASEKRCAFPGDTTGTQCDPASPDYAYQLFIYATDWSDSSARTQEQHEIADFNVGRDFGLGVVGNSEVSLGMRFADFTSQTDTMASGIPDWNLPEGWFFFPATHHGYGASIKADRKFKGAGPMLSLDGSLPMLGDDQTGRVKIDWSVAGGALFGKQKTVIAGSEHSGYYSSTKYTTKPFPHPAVGPVVTVPIHFARETSVSVPVVDLSLGLAYEIERFKFGAGYRWERYFNVLDAGFEEHKDYDRTLDGPYFKIAVGFGG